MKKKMLVALLCACMAVAGIPGGGSSQAEAAESGDMTLEFWTIDLKASFGEFFDNMIAQYEEENPGITINWTDVPYDDIQSKLVTAVAGGQAPDVVNMNTQMALTLAGQGALVDLNAAATDEQKSIYIESLWDSAKIGDSVYAFPWYASPDIMFYNADLFEQAGIEVPHTFDDAMEVCKDFYEKTGAYLFCPDEFFNLLFEYDIPVITEDGSSAAFNNQDTADLLAKFKEYSDAGYIPKTGWGDWDEQLKMFETGQLAIVSSSGSSLSRIKDEAPDIYEKVQVSTPLTGSIGLSRNPLMNLVIPNASENQEAAVDFAAYVTNDANQLAFCKEVSIFPSTIEASQDPYFTSDTSTLEGQASAMSVQASETSADFSLGVGNQNNIQTAVNKAYEAVIINGDEIQPALDQAEADVNALLAENNE